MRAVTRLAALCLAALVLAGPAGAAGTTKPSTTACRNKIINEWEGTGKISTTYPVSCYKAALTFVDKQADLRVYSSIADDIRLALQSRLQRAKGVTVPSFVGKGKRPTRTKTSTDAVPIPTVPGSGGGHDGKGGGGGIGPTLARGSTGSSSSGTPLPVLILGGVAIALLAAGAIGTGVRYSRRRG